MREDVIRVLDKGWVSLIDSMPSVHSRPFASNYGHYGGDEAVIQAARASTRKSDYPTIFDGWSDKSRASGEKLLSYLIENNELGPFEMVQFKFHIKAPIFVARQWFRYRTGKYSEQSGRYQEYPQDEYYVPSEWRLQASKNKQASSGLVLPEDAEELSDDLIQHISRSNELYQNALSKGVAREEARLFLPGFSAYTQWYWSQDARNVIHFIEERTDEDHAQWEIVQYARAIRRIFCQLLPYAGSLLGYPEAELV